MEYIKFSQKYFITIVISEAKKICLDHCSMHLKWWRTYIRPGISKGRIHDVLIYGGVLKVLNVTNDDFYISEQIQDLSYKASIKYLFWLNLLFS